MPTLKRVAVRLGAVVALLLTAACALIAWLHFSEWPGGMRSSYDAADYDARLTRIARSATPLIDALNRYRVDHSAFPEEASGLAPYLPLEVIPKGRYAAIHSWIYSADQNRRGYSLWYKLGWDPSLNYRFDGSRGEWVFDPGDGSDSKVLLLKP